MALPGQEPQQGPVATPPTGPSAITPGAQGGLEAQAMVKVRQAAMLLAESVGVLKSRLNTDLGKAVMNALKALAPHTPGVEEGLGQSELASMAGSLQSVRHAPPQGATPSWLGTRGPRPVGMGGPPMPMGR